MLGTAVSAMNGPLAMITLGVCLAPLDMRKTLKNRRIYLTSATRLVLILLENSTALSY